MRVLLKRKKIYNHQVILINVLPGKTEKGLKTLSKLNKIN